MSLRENIKKKLNPKAKKVVCIGYSEDHAADTYKFYDPNTRKTIDSRDVTWAKWHGPIDATENMPLFEEAKKNMTRRTKAAYEIDEEEEDPQDDDILVEDNDDDNSGIFHDEDDENHEEESDDDEEEQGEGDPPPPAPILRRSTRTTRWTGGTEQGGSNPPVPEVTQPVAPIMQPGGSLVEDLTINEEAVTSVLDEDEQIFTIDVIMGMTGSDSLQSDPGVPKTFKDI